MKLQLVRHLWGVDLSQGYGRHSKHWHDVGYTTLEGSLRFVPEPMLLLAALRDEGFGWIPQLFSYMQAGGGTAQQHIESLREQIEECLIAEPQFFNGQTGSDHWTFAEAEEFFSRVTEMETEYGVPIYHETHRSRYLGNPWNATRLLEQLPGLKLTCDFSHWVCVAERLLDDASDLFRLAADHCHHLHARVGYEQGPQVPDPRDTVWAAHLEAHERWWEMTWMAALARGDEAVTLTPEFGPPPYLHTLPYSGVPVSNLEDICDWMARRQSVRFESWSKRNAIVQNPEPPTT
jgi:hypothetical protein